MSQRDLRTYAGNGSSSCLHKGFENIGIRRLRSPSGQRVTMPGALDLALRHAHDQPVELVGNLDLASEAAV